MINPVDLIEKFGIKSPEDIDLEVISYHYGATIKYRSLSNCAARIIGKENRAIISVDKYSRVERQRFSIGHELGHWLNDRGSYVSCCEEDMVKFSHESKTKEECANRFSANLLMPDSLFRGYSRNMPITFDSVKELCGIFVTSLTATAIRLVELGSYPSMLVCYNSNGDRQWFVRNKDVPDFFYPSFKVSPGTVAYALLMNENPSKGPEIVDADCWVDHKDSYKYVLKENSIFGFEKTILSLLWWEDESQLLDIV